METRRKFAPTRGLDLKSGDLAKDPAYLSGGTDARLDVNGNWAKRWGFHNVQNVSRSAVVGNFYNGPTAIHEFSTTDYKGVSKKEIIGVDTKLKRYNVGTMTITCDVAQATIRLCFDEVTRQYRFQAWETDPAVLFIDAALGSGNILGAVSVSDLQAVIAASLQLSCSVSVAGAYPAAHLELINDILLVTGQSHTIKYYYSSDILQSSSFCGFGPLPQDQPARSIVEIGGDLYIPTGDIIPAPIAPIDTNYVAKYDGQIVCRAGLPDPSETYLGLYGYTDAAGRTHLDVRGDCGVIPTTYPVSSSGPYEVKTNLVYIDKTGRVTEASVSTKKIGIVNAGPAAQWFVVFDNTSHIGNGYNENCGMCSAAMAGAGTTISVDDGSGGEHSLQIGDVAYFYDRVQSRFISREITNRTANSITVSSTAIEVGDAGGSVQLWDNAVISANLRMAIWIFVSAAGMYLLADEVPVMSKAFISGTSRYYIQKDSSSLAAFGPAAILDESKKTGPCQRARYLAAYNGNLIAARLKDSTNTVAFGQIDNIESMPTESNSFDLDKEATGAGQSGPVLISFTKDQYYVISGDLDAGQFRVEKRSDTIGCVSHATIQLLEQGVLGFLSARGPMLISNGADLQPMGVWKDQKTSILEAYFQHPWEKRLTYDAVTGIGSYPKFECACAVSLPSKKLYILNIPRHFEAYPVMERDPAVGFSDTFVFDYSTGVWFPVWTGIEARWGIARVNDTVWTCGRVAIREMQIDKGRLNYGDHDFPIPQQVISNWEDFGDINVFKKYLWLTVYSTGTTDTQTWDIDIATYLNSEMTPINDPILRRPLTKHTDMTLTFDSSRTQKISQQVKLKSGKANSLCVLMGNDRWYENGIISGWDLEIAANFRKPATAFGNQR